MSNKWRRFEVLLPLRFNHGREVPPEWIAEAVLEIVNHFGAASYETQKVEGHWRQGGILYRDDLVRIVVDVLDNPSNRQWMRQFKDRWKVRLEQFELWMVSYNITDQIFVFLVKYFKLPNHLPHIIPQKPHQRQHKK